MTDTPEATDPIWRREAVETPCVKICQIHPTARLCVGCLRSLEEIGQWSQMTPAERRAVMAELPARAAQIAQRRGGRAGRVTD